MSAVAPGTVIYRNDRSDGYGNKVVIDHGGGYHSVYAHLSSFAVSLWARVSNGQLVGYAGGTGGVPVHLHMHTMLNSSAYRPERMSGVSGFGWYGFSVESGLGCGNNGHDPSQYWTSATPAWHGWYHWGNVAAGSPVAISYSDSRSDFIWVVKRSGSDIYERHWNGSAWVPHPPYWTNISSGGSDPVFNGNVAISNRYGQVTVIAMASNLMWVKTWNGSSWSAWSNISDGGPITGSISVSNGPNGRVDIVGVASNTVWWQYFNGSTWMGWYDMSNGSPITGEVAVANRSPWVHVVGIAGGQAWLKWWNYSGGQANGWYTLGGPIDGSLAIDNVNATPNDPGTPYYPPCPRCGVQVVAMAGGNAWQRCGDIDCFQTGWNLLGGPLAGPLTISNENLQMHVVGRDSAGILWLKWWG